jgi:class 3 adenylate cyclase
MTTEDFKRKLTAILSTDVVGYPRLMVENEASTVRYMEVNKKLIFQSIYN